MTMHSDAGVSPAAAPQREQKAHSRYTVGLSDCGSGDGSMVGGKAVGLGRLLGHGFPVPPGFVVTTSAYRDSLADAGIGATVDDILARHAGEPDQRPASTAIQALFREGLVTPSVENAIREAYASLVGDEERPVAVRSSATAEDLADASFAGQQDTYLWIQGADDVVQHVLKCWASLFTPQAIAYRARFHVPAESLAMGVVVQWMVPAATAGVMMTLEPVTGDRSTIYVEAAYGLGEGVVRGDVPTDRFWIDKRTANVRRELGIKDAAHHFDPAAGQVRILPVGEADQRVPTLAIEEISHLGDLGAAVEEAFGAPMDIEWAVDARGRELFLLQARPETVWSTRTSEDTQTREAPSLPSIAVEAWDPTHRLGAPGEWYSRDNVGEAMPGVLTPLTWSLWGPVGELNARQTGYQLGVLSRREAEIPHDDRERYVQVFFGRVAMQARFLATVGDRMPGVTGADVVRGIFSEAPADMEYQPTIRRYPIVAVRLPLAFLRTPARIRALADRTDAWWRQEIDAMTGRDRAAAVHALEQAGEQFAEALVTHSVGLVGVVQPLFDALEKLVARVGVGDVGVLSGFGGAEMAIVGDIWRASRGELELEQVVGAHGFHGPGEGELSSRVWREDPTPIRRMIAEYAGRDAADEPALKERRAVDELRAMQRQVLAASPLLARPAAALLMRLAASRLPLRGVAKRSFVQSLDVARAAARRIGELEVRAGRLDEADDIFYLTAEEITSGWPANPGELVAQRRARRLQFQQLDVPGNWQGDPTPAVAGPPAAGEGLDAVQGIGVSAGIVEGVARVVTDPSFGEVQPDEILVAPTTDPSWSSIMFVSAALVVDIGGALSHAAVVARELGLPCVVSTRTGTRVIRTGDRVRVDGSTGTVQVLQRATQPV